MHHMAIGDVAREAEVSTQTLRFYERQGLLPQPPRGANGYRDYPPETVSRVLFIKRAKALGFSLKEIHELLNVVEDDSAGAGDIKHRAQLKLAEIEAEIVNLKRTQSALRELVNACPGHGIKERCPILHALRD